MTESDWEQRVVFDKGTREKVDSASTPFVQLKGRLIYVERVENAN